MKIRVGIDIAVPPAELWQTLEAIENHVQWMTDARAINFVGSQRRGVDTEFDCVTQVGPFRTTDRMVVTEWSPNEAMGIVHRGVVTGAGRFTLHDGPGGHTEFTWEEELQFPWWMGGAIGAAAAKPLLTWVWRRNLEHLKQIAEGRGE
jgi:uncharacterized protein YndB with AHSA1/START domain